MCRKLVVTNKLSLGNRELGWETYSLPKGEVVEFTSRQLKDAIRKKCFFGLNPDSESLYISNERHKEALKEAASFMENAKESCEAGMPEDFISIDLMGAYQALGKILGETLDEDLVNNIFEKFCLGK